MTDGAPNEPFESTLRTTWKLTNKVLRVDRSIGGKTYYVCTQSCKDEVDEDPEQYATEAAQAQDNPCREAAETALESTAAILL